ncbi:alpha/beta fold hydrolase [Pantoea sp. Ap-967]|uniref:alpha/beta fold hydrolase n=1 Tax=Pantoea sp. Ap-967 TaxID=2608362 RepID=UPI0014249AC6|nr:alpha/beta fold hydrolase [Pantoea sp. Ap-967]NIE77448.1 alpha/beta fold hydrolase [Pantoea sp. Ap-967]
MPHHALRSLARTLLLLLASLLALPALAAPQTLRLGQATHYHFLAFANHDLQQASLPVQRAVVLLHGVQRNADDYFASGQHLLQNAGLSADDTLLLAPNFLTPRDRRAGDDMPLWAKDKWMHGTASQDGRVGIAGFTVLDDLLAYLGNREHFPALKEIVLIGHSAGGQLLQRYALLGAGSVGRGIALRYVISSPSSYLYVDGNRWQNGAFKPVPAGQCPGYNQYRYGLEQAPPYFVQQNLDARQLFKRYAAREVTYMVGARDNNPESRVMDRSCGAALQGANRVERQLGYLRYEAFLAKQWRIAVHHRHFQVSQVGHDEARLFAAKSVARRLFPAH